MLRLLLALFTLVRYGLAARSETSRSESWPTTEGRIHEAGVVEEHGVALGEVVYSYSAQGEYYTGALRRHFSTGNQTERWLDGFPRDARVLIRYRPDKPEHSVLRPDDNAQRLPAFAPAV